MTLDAVLKSARGYWRCATFLLALAAALAIAIPSEAAIAPLPILAATPVDGTVIVATSASVPISITTSGLPPSAYLSGEVSTQNVQGQDGTLANDYQVSLVGMTRSDANPAVFTGSFGFGWAPTPGTYYWQLSTTVVNSNGTGLDVLSSPVYTIVVTAPPAPAVPAPVPVAPPVVVPIATPTYVQAPEQLYRMSLADLGYDALLAISKHSATAGHLKRKCTRATRVSFKCTVSWRDLRFAYAGTLRITDKGDGSPRSTFVGLRAKLSCLKTRSAASCAKVLRW